VGFSAAAEAIEVAKEVELEVEVEVEGAELEMRKEVVDAAAAAEFVVAAADALVAAREAPRGLRAEPKLGLLLDCADDELVGPALLSTSIVSALAVEPARVVTRVALAASAASRILFDDDGRLADRELELVALLLMSKPLSGVPPVVALLDNPKGGNEAATDVGGRFDAPKNGEGIMPEFMPKRCDEGNEGSPLMGFNPRPRPMTPIVPNSDSMRMWSMLINEDPKSNSLKS
jgi:hypothetical protein